MLGLIEELFEPPGRRPPDYTRERAREGFRHCVHSPEADVLLAVDGEEVVGLATVYADFPSIRLGWRAWIEDLVVTSSWRGRGVGKLLLDVATHWAAERGCTHLELDSGLGRKDSHRFYLREGMSHSLQFRREVRPPG